MNKLIVFDLDGTLCYTIEDLALGVNYSITESGYPALSQKKVMKLVGNSTAYMIQHALPSDVSPEVFDKVLADFTAYYAVHFCDHVTIYPGAIETLCKLKERGYLLACVSNKPNAACREMVHKLFPEYLFSFVLGALPSFIRKPDAQPLDFTFDYLDASKEGSYYVGDSEVDILFAENAGIPCISCSWGYRSEKLLRASGATQIIHSFPELNDVIV